MNKKELQTVFKSVMKRLGYTVRGNNSYKFIGDNYLVAVMLDHHPFAEAYFVEYGVVFDPDDKYLPFNGRCDWRSHFIFSCNDDNTDSECSIDYYEYPLGTKEHFEEELLRNITQCVPPVCNRDFVLEIYRNDWIQFRKIPYDTVRKIARLANLDENEVIQIRDSNVRKWP